LIFGCQTSVLEKNLPAVINEAFKTKYPQAQKISWSSQDTDKFKVDFSFKNEKISSVFSSDGKWILTEKKIITSKLPSTVLNTIQNGFGDYNIQSIKQVESAYPGNYYSIKLKNGNKQITLNLSHDGVILNDADTKRDQN